MQLDLSPQLRELIADFVFQIAALRAENAALRAKLAEAADGQGNSESPR